MSTARMTRADIEAVLEQVPRLNDFGIGVFDPRSKTAEQREEDMRRDRQKLLDSAEACTRVCGWLGLMEKTKTINDRHTSYGLKHMAEKAVGYITNGVFIAAAIHCGFPFKLIPGSPNVCFGISERSLRRLPREQRQAV